MSLIKCEKCYNYVSEYAEKCPKCGESLNENVRKFINDIDLSDEKYEEKYFSYIHEKVKKEKKRKKNAICIIISLVICLVLGLGVFKYIEYNNEKKRVEQDKEILLALEETLGAPGNLDHSVQCSETVSEYYNEGVTLFEDVYGQISLFTPSDISKELNVCSLVHFESDDEVSCEKAASIMEELELIYGAPSETKSTKDVNGDEFLITTWEKDDCIFGVTRKANHEDTILLWWN